LFRARRDGCRPRRSGSRWARRVADILSRHRDASAGTGGDPEPDPAQFAADDAVFTAVLDAANECLGRFDRRPAGDRGCDALLQILRLAELDVSA
jgi:hypothetical protein